MRKLIMLNRISLDGFFAGPKGEIDWFIHDPDVDKAAHQMMRADTLLFGRLTYDMFFGYWPQVARDPNASAGRLGLGRRAESDDQGYFFNDPQRSYLGKFQALQRRILPMKSGSSSKAPAPISPFSAAARSCSSLPTPG